MSLSETRVTTLGNGLTIATDYLSSVKTVTVGLWNRAGSRFEAANNNGVAHFLEHMVFKGTQRRSALDIAKEIEEVGGYLNAYTANEVTAYYARVMQENVSLGLDIVSDLLLNATFPLEELEKERGVILQEIGMYADDPHSLVGQVAQRVAFGDHPLGWSILGPAELISTMPKQILTDFLHTHYAPNNMVLAASGAVHHEQLVEQAERIFGHLPRKVTAPPEKAVYTGGDARLAKDLEQTNLVLGFEGVDYYHDDFYALSVLAVVLGDGMSSRLFQEIREKRGLVYSISAFVDAYADSGMFGVHCGTGPQQVTELLPVLCDSLAGAKGTFREDEIKRAKAQFRAQNVMALESTFRRAEKLAQNIIKYNRIVPLEETLAKIELVDAAKLDMIATRIFSTMPSFAAVGPIDNVESFDSLRARLVV